MSDAPPLPTPPALSRRRDRAWLFVALILAALVAIALPILRERVTGEQQVRNEDAAAAMLVRLAQAEREFHEREGRYAFLEDLLRAGLLEAFDVVGEVDRRHVRAPGFRIDVLLPSGRVGSSNVSLVTSQDPTPPDPELARHHFSLVARPDVPGETAWRAWYLDEDGELYLNEGVTDAEGARKNLLPRTQVKESQYLLSGRALLWQRASTLSDAD